MSTRATYQVKDERGYKATLYIHHDGYPKGAAQYFEAACRCANTRGSMADRLIRSVDGAEITLSHEAHGDTDYRYTLHRGAPNQPDMLRAEKRGREYAEGWLGIFLGPLAEFLNQYGEHKGRWRAFGRYPMHADDLTARATEHMAEARRQLAKGWTGNASSSAGDVARYIAAGAEIDREEFTALLRETCESFPNMVEYHLREAFPEMAVAEVQS